MGHFTYSPVSEESWVIVSVQLWANLQIGNIKKKKKALASILYMEKHNVASVEIHFSQVLCRA